MKTKEIITRIAVCLLICVIFVGTSVPQTTNSSTVENTEKTITQSKEMSLEDVQTFTDLASDLNRYILLGNVLSVNLTSTNYEKKNDALNKRSIAIAKEMLTLNQRIERGIVATYKYQNLANVIFDPLNPIDTICDMTGPHGKNCEDVWKRFLQVNAKGDGFMKLGKQLLPELSSQNTILKQLIDGLKSPRGGSAGKKIDWGKFWKAVVGVAKCIGSVIVVAAGGVVGAAHELGPAAGGAGSAISNAGLQMVNKNC